MSHLALEWGWLIKVTLLLAAVWVVWFVARKSNPRWQVWPFRVGLLGVVLLSLVSFAPPLLEWPVSVATISQQPANTIVDTIEAQPPSVIQAQQPRAATNNDKVAEYKSSPAEITRVQQRNSLQPAIPEQAAAPEVAAWDWPALAVKFWVFVVAIGVLRIAIGTLRLTQLVARSAEPSEAVLTAATKLASAMQLATPAVRVTDEISSPSVAGLFRPVILLPTSFAASNNSQTLASALSHELAHIAASDLRWDAALRFFQLFAWAHPLVWGMHRAHRAACERVSDLVAADLIDDRTAYADCLASIALKLRRSPSGYGLAMARQADVVTRLKTLASGLQAKALGRRGKVGALAALLIALAIGTTAVVQVQQSTAQEPVPAQESKTFVLTVLSADDNQPLVDAKVNFSYHCRDEKLRTEKVRTDQSGVAKFTFPSGGKDASFNIFCRHSGHVLYFTGYDRQPIELLPTSKTIRMKLGELVGGVIVDAKGNPVTNAELSVLVPSDPPQDSYMFGLPTTGPDGRWKFDAAPRPVSQLLLRVRHYQYKNADLVIRSGLDQKYALASGWAIAGTVRSADQTPVANAKVVSSDRRLINSSPKATTDLDGAYQLAGLDAKSTWLTVTADGYSPAMKRVDSLDGKLTQADWVLEPGHTIRFQFEDPSGKPIKGASILADTWRGNRSLQWRSKANADGFVEWTSAPEDVVTYDFSRRGYRPKRNIELLPREKPHTIVLEPAPELEYTVTGNVIDSESGKPVANLVAEFGYSRGKEIYWLSSDKFRGSKGKFRLKYGETQLANYSERESKLFVRVTADGYWPWVSEELDVLQPAPSLSIELKPGTGRSAVVLDPAGKPAQYAVVALGLGRNSIEFQRGYQDVDASQQTKTDAAGQFQFASG